MKTLIIPMIALAALLSLGQKGCQDELGKLNGKVEFRGVPCQPGQPDFNVPPCSGAYPNYEVAIMKVGEDAEAVMRIKSGPDGTFQTALPAGDYLVRTQNGPLPKNQKETTFTIKAKESTELKLMVSTGIL